MNFTFAVPVCRVFNASLLGFAMLAAGLSAHCAEPAKQLLWPKGAPGAKGSEPKDQPWIDLYPVSKEKSNGAAFVVCPGGGYGGLAADHEGSQIAKFFNSLGVHAVVLHYRLGTSGYHHPIELNDAKRAIRWVRANAAQHGVDPQRIGVIGFSAGGHLASCTATMFDDGDAQAADPIDRVSSRPDVAVLCYPVISMSDDFMHRGSRKNLLGPNDNDQLGREMTTYLRVTDRTPPTFIFQTDEDTAVPAENAVHFYLACRKHKIPTEMHIYQPGPHGVGLIQGDPVLGTWSGHLRDWLRNQGFFRPAKRAAIDGKVTIDGKPVSWGSVLFEPEDASAPRACARVMGGRFKLDAKNGPVIGKARLLVSYSTADVSGLDDPDGVAETGKESPGAATDLTAEIKEAENHLALELRHR